MLIKVKKTIAAVAALSLLLVISGCGGVSEKDLFGDWSIDVSSIDIEFGDNASSEEQLALMIVKANFESSSKSKELESMSFTFEKGGKLSIGTDDYSFDGKWKLRDENLTVSVEFLDTPLEITTQIEMDGHLMTAAITGEEIIRRIRSTKEDIKDFMGLDSDYDKYKGLTFSVNFARK